MKVNNPFVDVKRDLIIKLDRERDRDQIKILQAKYEENEKKLQQYNNDILQKLKDTIEVKLERTEYVQEELKISPRKQYQQAIALYRQAIALVNDIRHIKKECRESLKLTTEKNKIQKTKIDKWIK